VNTLPEASEEAMLPTDEDVQHYREHGWWVSGKIVPDELLDAAIEASERYYAGGLDDGPDLHEWCYPPQPPLPGLRKNDYASLRCRALMDVVRLPAIVEIAARLRGARGFRLWHDQLLYKPPSEPGALNNVGWHTDRSYWLSCTADDMLTAWVPFHTITPGHGPLMMIDGSNQWSEGPPKTEFFRQDIEVQESEIRQGRTIEKVPILLERGQVSFHHCRTFHGSGPNHSTEPRRSLAVHLQPLDNRASGAVGPDGERITHPSDFLCRWDGDLPDYTDPQIFPVLQLDH